MASDRHRRRRARATHLARIGPLLASRANDTDAGIREMADRAADLMATLPVGAIVVNWNGWRDTVCCLESLLALDDPPARIIVCDNASTDGSLAEMAAWARNFLHGWTPSASGFVSAQSGKGVESIDFVGLDKNLGYAGGLNAGLQWARKHWPLHGFWFLNNDVYAQQGALRALVDAAAAVPGVGICGSVLLEWDDPTRVLAVAGRFRKWLGVGWATNNLPPGLCEVSFDLDFPVGASMFVKTEYLDKVGSMDPSYFLYCEEMDWAERGRRLGFIPVVALRSRLRHREGASTGSRGGARAKSMLSERYGVINRLRITRKFWPWLLPIVWSSLCVVVLDRLLHRETGRALLVLRVMISPSMWMR